MAKLGAHLDPLALATPMKNPRNKLINDRVTANNVINSSETFSCDSTNETPLIFIPKKKNATNSTIAKNTPIDERIAIALYELKKSLTLFTNVFVFILIL